MLERMKKITASELITYLNSLEKEKEREKGKRVHEYKFECNIKQTKIKKREIAKIEKEVDKEYSAKLNTRDEILDLLEECSTIPTEIEKLKITEYMLYRVDIRKAEKVIHKVTKQLQKSCQEILDLVERKIEAFPIFDNIEVIDYSEYDTKGPTLAKIKQEYALEYTEEERRGLIAEDLKMIEQVKEFNSVPIPHEILRNSDKEIQSKMQKFNSIRQKRIRILNTMEEDYEKLLIPREIFCMIDEAMKDIEKCQDILTKTEYHVVKKLLERKKRKIDRSTRDIRSIIDTKEKKTGMINFNIQQARYLRMENLRDTIIKGTRLIKENPLDELEVQLEKLKISYQREKQFASVIQNLNGGQAEEHRNRSKSV